MTSETPKNTDQPSEPPADSVGAAFAQLRAAAQQRSGKAPDLSKQGRNQLPRQRGADQGLVPGVPGLGGAGEAAKAGVDKRRVPRGKPTGPDGRRLPKRPNLDNFGAVLGTEIVRRGWRRELAGGWVQSHWEELVGEKIAQHTTVEMLKDKALFITCDSTAWATNLRMMQRQILQAIAAKVGPDVISELKIYGPKAPSWRKGPLHVKGRGPRDTYG
ncbi:DciA family protein [Corynebacterium sp. A21]|uniref:DciA family protein n=1 Tax=Corynebacterium sp. A21 TaxID=3457318 RepID=UPI003FD00D68